MPNIISDRKLLKKVYQHYYKDYVGFDSKNPNRDSIVYVPIDIYFLAEEFGLSPELIFGRFHYHLNKKHGYTNPDGSLVRLFSPKLGKSTDVVNFALLSAVVAELEEGHSRFIYPLILSLTALAISVLTWIVKTT